MPMVGSSRSRPRPSALRAVALLLLVAAAPYQVDGDAIPLPLTGQPGNPARGRALMLARQVTTCLLCHAAPLPEERFQGTIGPSLAGVGARLSSGQIRLRIVDPTIVNPETVMPRFFTTTGLTRVGAAWQGKPVLGAAEIEDIVAYLATLTAP